jgi:hypothetical protein
MTRKPSDRATQVEIVKISDRLREVCTKLDGGMCTYADGVTDQSIADDLKVARSSVQNLRTAMFGKLRAMPTAEAERIETIINQNEFLKEQNERLAMFACELTRRFNSLVAMLATTRTADCKHLHMTGFEPRQILGATAKP